VDSGNCRIIDRCFVHRVVHQNRKALGVECQLANGKKVNIKSRITVVSGGSLNSPTLLLRSKVNNPNIGKNLRLHPVVLVMGKLDRTVNPYDGCPMTWYSDVAGNRDGKHYGAKLETPASHCGVFSGGLPWNSPEFFKKACLEYTNTALSIIMCRDKGSGQVTIDANGKMKINYQISKFDQESLIEGSIAIAKMLISGGAKEIITGNEGLEPFRPTSTDINAPEALAFYEKLRKLGMQNFRQNYYSAHQMGTCRMGIDKKTSVINPKGESWDVKNLYIADASTFPTSSGANPMITTEAISYSIAQNIKAALGQTKSKL